VLQNAHGNGATACPHLKEVSLCNTIPCPAVKSKIKEKGVKGVYEYTSIHAQDEARSRVTVSPTRGPTISSNHQITAVPSVIASSLAVQHPAIAVVSEHAVVTSIRHIALEKEKQPSAVDAVSTPRQKTTAAAFAWQNPSCMLAGGAIMAAAVVSFTFAIQNRNLGDEVAERERAEFLPLTKDSGVLLADYPWDELVA
jgi:hypothetical protein